MAKKKPIKTCSVKGCKRKCHAKGYCKLHYQQTRRTNGKILEKNIKHLTYKHLKFVNNIAKGMVQDKAYVKAGFSPKGANQGASRLLRHVNIKEAIERRKSAATERAVSHRVNIIREYARIGFFDIRKLYDKKGELKKIQDIDNDTAAALAGLEAIELTALTTDKVKAFTKKYKIADKIRALDSLSKIEGLFEKDNKQKGEGFAEGLSNLLDDIDGGTAGINGK